ncbi:hypothetical protein CISG_09841 [Coccidioides immitis RMSCC 3703]|uniref:Uncharacterized protein n=1 Tax=Coccidioides immitis RMSCC 3703 TaxID=454286 RepID=A0A0J8QKA9_COCIT|nr:hypothetical protein CISG_09841 [Coccidioides immitis RMSCC 3703]
MVLGRGRGVGYHFISPREELANLSDGTPISSCSISWDSLAHSDSSTAESSSPRSPVPCRQPREDSLTTAAILAQDCAFSRGSRCLGLCANGSLETPNRPGIQPSDMDPLPHKAKESGGRSPVSGETAQR